MTLSQRAAYIQGLVDGCNIDETTNEGKVILALVDLVADMTDAIEEIDEDLNTLNDYIEEIDEDLGGVEEILYEDCDCEDCDCDCDDCDCDCDCDEDEEYFEIECPACGEHICMDSSIDPEELSCPACGEKFECVISEEDLEELD